MAVSLGARLLQLRGGTKTASNLENGSVRHAQHPSQLQEPVPIFTILPSTGQAPAPLQEPSAASPRSLVQPLHIVNKKEQE